LHLRAVPWPESLTLAKLGQTISTPPKLPAVTKTKRAFTLIELLVVIAIIGILASLLMPAFRAAQETGRTSACASNLKQIGAAMFMFAQDHGDCFPESGGSIAWGTTDPKTNQGPWMQQIAAYISGTNADPQYSHGASVFTCPSSSLLTKTLPWDQYYSYFNGGHQGGFGAVRKSMIAMPSEHILSGDITDWNGGGALDADKDDYTQNPFDLKATFHNGVVNILFADGHVEAAKWLANPLSQGYFDPTRMATHYQGTINPATNQYFSYLLP